MWLGWLWQLCCLPKKKKKQKKNKKFMEVDMMFMITVCIQILLIASFPVSQIAKYSTKCSAFMTSGNKKLISQQPLGRFP
jgi:formate hydrogenlyase subunit 3/multisubunit Na+/H+ antiporter MnhD subunit